MRTALASVALVLALSGCATVEVGGLTLGQALWEKDEAELRKRVAFETGCPAPSLTVVPLTAASTAPQVAASVGVTGCDRRLVYVRPRNGEWMLDGSSATTK